MNQSFSEDLQLLFGVFPERFSDYAQGLSTCDDLIEIIFDLGRFCEFRFLSDVQRLEHLGEVTLEDLDCMTQKLRPFDEDNRTGIERTLHRLSAIRNRTNEVIGLTCRVGRAVEEKDELVKQMVLEGKSCLILGPPGVGKTTLLRETARGVAQFKRVVIVDTSNEIAGDGDVPHPAIGYARRMQLSSSLNQAKIMIQAVENHMPEVIIVDEIGTIDEALAARTIAERGVQLVATAHGKHLENLIKNPVLSDLVGGIQHVVLGDEEAKFRGTNKTVLERKSLPTFDVVVEMRSRNMVAIYNPVIQYIDAFLKEDPLAPLLHFRDEPGAEPQSEREIQKATDDLGSAVTVNQLTDDPHMTTCYLHGLSPDDFYAAFQGFSFPIKVSRLIKDASFLLTTAVHMKSKSKVSKLLEGRQIPVHVVARNEQDVIYSFLKDYFGIEDEQNVEEDVFREIEYACGQVQKSQSYLEVSPQRVYYRRLQHQYVQEQGLNSISVGVEPNRRVKVYSDGR